MKTETKDLGMETCSGERGVKEEKFPYNRKPCHRPFCGELWNLRGQYKMGGGEQNPQNMHVTATNSGEGAQMFVSTTRESGLDREVWAASSVLKVRTGPEFPRDNLRELM